MSTFQEQTKTSKQHNIPQKMAKKYIKQKMILTFASMNALLSSHVYYLLKKHQNVNDGGAVSNAENKGEERNNAKGRETRQRFLHV